MLNGEEVAIQKISEWRSTVTSTVEEEYQQRPDCGSSWETRESAGESTRSTHRQITSKILQEQSVRIDVD